MNPYPEKTTSSRTLYLVERFDSKGNFVKSYGLKDENGAQRIRYNAMEKHFGHTIAFTPKTVRA
jgi:hypothetical protein